MCPQRRRPTRAARDRHGPTDALGRASAEPRTTGPTDTRLPTDARGGPRVRRTRAAGRRARALQRGCLRLATCGPARRRASSRLTASPFRPAPPRRTSSVRTVTAYVPCLATAARPVERCSSDWNWPGPDHTHTDCGHIIISGPFLQQFVRQ